jgi:hypothetical protein
MSRWLEWTTKDGEIIHFKMPSKVHQELTVRLVRLVKDGERIGRTKVTIAEAIAAAKVAIMTVLCHGSEMRDFYLDRVAMSQDHSQVFRSVKLGEWMIRRAREILEAVQFVQRDPTKQPLTKWQRYTYEDGYHPERARQKPTKFSFGDYFYAWIAFASRKVRFLNQKSQAQPERDSEIQDENTPDSFSGCTTPLSDSVGHSGESEWVDLDFQPQWWRDPDHEPEQMPLRRLSQGHHRKDKVKR